MSWLDGALAWVAEQHEKSHERAERKARARAAKDAARHPRPISKLHLGDGPPQAIGGIRIKMGKCQYPKCGCLAHDKVLAIGSHEVCSCGHVQMLHVEEE